MSNFGLKILKIISGKNLYICGITEIQGFRICEGIRKNSFSRTDSVIYVIVECDIINFEDDKIYKIFHH